MQHPSLGEGGGNFTPCSAPATGSLSDFKGIPPLVRREAAQFRRRSLSAPNSSFFPEISRHPKETSCDQSVHPFQQDMLESLHPPSFLPSNPLPIIFLPSKPRFWGTKSNPCLPEPGAHTEPICRPQLLVSIGFHLQPSRQLCFFKRKGAGDNDAPNWSPSDQHTGKLGEGG